MNEEMNENYIVINGKRTELTEEQLEKLGIAAKKENLFARELGCFYAIGANDVVLHLRDDWKSVAKYTVQQPIENFFRAANYCTDKKLMEQRALHEKLYRLLWRFSCENGELENPWDGKHHHYYICRDDAENLFSFGYIVARGGGTIYFPTKEIAARAIDEIVKPFVVEHPDFVW